MPRKHHDNEPLSEMVDRFDPDRHGGEFPRSDLKALKGLIPRPERPVDIDSMKPRFPRAELLAECDPNAPIPESVRDWEASTPAGCEFTAIRTLPISRVRRELASIVRRGDTVRITRRGRTEALLGPAIQLGALEGRFDVPDDFDAPLSEVELARFSAS